MSNKILDILKVLEELTLIEIFNLIKEIETKFNIKNSLNLISLNEDINLIKNEEQKFPIKIEYTLILNSILADKKIAVLKLVRNLTGLGLKESKDIVDNLPHILKEKVLKEEAEKIKKEFDEVGGSILLKE
jgi:large subunit ribosomal protein L7/L12